MTALLLILSLFGPTEQATPTPADAALQRVERIEEALKEAEKALALLEQVAADAGIGPALVVKPPK